MYDVLHLFNLKFMSTYYTYLIFDAYFCKIPTSEYF